VPLNQSQILDSNIVEESELASTGNTHFSGPWNIISVTTATKTIVLTGVELPFERVAQGDRVTITGGLAAGTYTVNEVVNYTTLTVNEAISSATSGTVDFYYPPGSTIVGFDSTGLDWTTADECQTAIIDAYNAAKGIRTFPFELHFVEGTKLNTIMGNGSFFRVRPGTFSSGSYSGYPSAFPLQAPFPCRLYSMIITFRQAAFDYNVTPGPILWELETREHFYNGSDIINRILVRFGSFSGSSTGTDTFRYELFLNNSGGDGFSYISGDEDIDYGKMIGCRYVKAPSGDRRINSWTDIVLKLNYEEII
jgi:hypothetical protein